MAADPLIRNNFIDSCAFDPKYEPETTASNDIFRLFEAEHFQLLIAHSTQKEIDHPHTPDWVKRAAGALNFSMEVQLTAPEHALLNDITSIVAGNGKPANIAQDARHIFEAQKYGTYFITTDERLLSRANALRTRCSVEVLRPTEFREIVERFIRERKDEA